MTTLQEELTRAHEDRRSRAESLLDEQADSFLNRIGLTEEKCIELAIDPGERKQLKGIIARLRKVPHPFTTCMRDLRKHKPDWTEDRRKRTCQSLKVAAGRAGEHSASINDGVCMLLTDAQATLLEHADQEALAEIEAERWPD